MDNTAVNSICVKAVSLKSYEYVINNNNHNKHYTGKDEIYGIISPYFESSPKQLSLINTLIREFKSFEVDTKHQKIFMLENDKEEERKKLRKNILKKYFSLEEFSKKRDELNSNLKNSSRRM